jgi:hypothetical protein
MAAYYTPLRKTLATVGLTSLFSLFLYSFSGRVKAQTFSSYKPKLSNQQEDILKCGYRKKEITLNFLSEQLHSKRPEGQGTRVEPDFEHRCGGYAPPIRLTALIPESNIGMTVAEYPRFFLYIPEADLEGAEGHLVLRNDKNEEIYKQSVKLKDTDSIVSIDLSGSPSLPPLEVGKSYFWEFWIFFDPPDRSDSTYVSGWIKRVEPNSELKHKLDTALPQEQPAIYAANGIWFEALASLVKLRCSSPNDATLASDWESLLQQVGLPEISRKPLSQCYQAKAP